MTETAAVDIEIFQEANNEYSISDVNFLQHRDTSRNAQNVPYVKVWLKTNLIIQESKQAKKMVVMHQDERKQNCILEIRDSRKLSEDERSNP